MTNAVKPFKIFIVLGLTAFCSICYELLIGQAIALTFGGTLNSYTLTIGLFLFFMGLGSLNAERIPFSFLTIELLIMFFGLLSPALIIYFAGFPNASGTERVGLQLISYSALSFVGFLTGLELPLAFQFLKQDKQRSFAIAVDYIGSFLAGIIFAFLLFPKLGLPLSILIAAALNLLAAILVGLFGITKANRSHIVVISISVIAIGFLVCKNEWLFQTLSSLMVTSR